MKALTISIDCGTQSIRAIAIDEKGNSVCEYKHIFENPYFSLNSGWAEQDPSVWVDGMFTSISYVTSNLKKEQKSLIKSISITTMRDTYICLDENKNVLRPSILWLDQRLSGVKKKMPFKSRFLFKIVGMTNAVETNRQAAACNWIMENEKDIWDKTKYYVSLSGYLNYKLSDILVDSIGSQCGHIPYDYKKNKYYDKNHYKFPIFPIDSSKLVKLVKSSSKIGTIKKDICLKYDIPLTCFLIASGTDKGCETLGSGCINSQWASLSFGTTSTVQLTVDKYIEPQKFLPSYPSVRPNFYNSELEVYRGYWMVTWFIDQFGHNEKNISSQRNISAENVFDETLDTIPPGCEGLVLQPYWGPGLKIPEAKGSIVGFSDYHTKYHLYRAIVEGINYALLEGLLKVEKRAKVKVKYLTVNGGGAKSDRICQITANMFGLPVYRCQTTETSSLGSAICAMVGSGVYKDFEEAILNMVTHTKIFTPDKQIHDYYSKLFKNVYLPLYDKLKPQYQKLRKIIEKVN